MKTLNNITISVIFLSLISMQTLFAGGVVITNKASSIDSISASAVKALFMKKQSSFSDGSKAIVGDQTEGSDIRNEFTKNVIGKKPKKLKRYWSKRVFAGKGTPPKEVGDNAAMLEWIAKTPNSLGYVSADAVNDTVKVVLEY